MTDAVNRKHIVLSHDYLEVRTAHGLLWIHKILAALLNDHGIKTLNYFFTQIF